MNKKLLITSAFLGAVILLNGCNSSSSSGGGNKNPDDKTDLQVFIEGFDQEPGVSECGKIGKLLSEDTLNVGGDDKFQCVLPARIGKNATLTDDIIWIATSKVKVGFGDYEIEDGDVEVLKDNSVTLTIDAGTEIRSTSGGAIVITRGSKIQANGTSANPIIMSSLEQTELSSEDYEGAGEWGGLVLQGFGKHNGCENESKDKICNILGEGDVGYFGGNDNSDNSGKLKYVVVTEGGTEVAPDNEINGVTFQGVGSGTQVEYIQVNNNADDGVEFFGGSVNVKYLVLTDNEDDSIDWDEGYKGSIQYGLVVHGSVRDKGIESDNNGNAMDTLPRSMPTLANITFVGNGGGTALLHREGTGAFMFNSIVSNFGTCLDIDNVETHNVIDTDLVYEDVIFDCNNAVAGDTTENGGDDFAQSLLDSIISTITEVDPALDSDYASAVGAANNLTTSFANATSADTDFLEVTDFAGALEDGDTAWWAGWTVGSILNP